MYPQDGIISMGPHGCHVGRQFGQVFLLGGDHLGQIADRAAGHELFVQMVLLEQGQSLQFGIRLGECEHRGVARCNRFYLRVTQFLTTDVLGDSRSVVAGDDLTDKPRLGFQGLPHVGVEGSLGDVAVDLNFGILIALAKNAAIALFDFRRFPGGINAGRTIFPLEPTFCEGRWRREKRHQAFAPFAENERWNSSIAIFI
jgi:hypothetical protein